MAKGPPKLVVVDRDAFAPLAPASPFLLGYSVHDEEEVILRMLNWPGPAGPGAAAGPGR